MKRQQKSNWMLKMIVVLVAAGLFLPNIISAGNLEPTGPIGPAMHTLDEIYNKFDVLEAIGDSNNCISENYRFCDLGDGTVRDNNTGLIWLKNANAFGQLNLDEDVQSAMAALEDGQYGLIDGSTAGDWRIPSIEEFEAFVSNTYTHPRLCNADGTAKWEEGDAFNNVMHGGGGYWAAGETGTTSGYGMTVFDMSEENTTSTSPPPQYVWPVRDKQFNFQGSTIKNIGKIRSKLDVNSGKLDSVLSNIDSNSDQLGSVLSNRKELEGKNLNFFMLKVFQK